MMVIDGESGDELEDLTDIVRRSEKQVIKEGQSQGSQKGRRTGLCPKLPLVVIPIISKN